MSLATYPLDEIWPRVLPRIEQIHHEQCDYVDWEPHDVLRACRRGRAFIFCSDDDDSFAVVRMKQRNGEFILFVWIAYGINGKRERNIGFIKEIARNAGASRIEMGSPRRGFDRVPGWKRGMTMYSMEV